MVTYAGNPDKKGLDLIAQAWGSAPPAGRRLIVTGIDAERGRGFLRDRGVSEDAIGKITVENPWRAFARASRG